MPAPSLPRPPSPFRRHSKLDQSWHLSPFARRREFAKQIGLPARRQAGPAVRPSARVARWRREAGYERALRAIRINCRLSPGSALSRLLEPADVARWQARRHLLARAQVKWGRGRLMKARGVGARKSMSPGASSLSSFNRAHPLKPTGALALNFVLTLRSLGAPNFRKLILRRRNCQRAFPGQRQQGWLTGWLAGARIDVCRAPRLPRRTGRPPRLIITHNSFISRRRRHSRPACVPPVISGRAGGRAHLRPVGLAERRRRRQPGLAAPGNLAPRS